MSIFFPADTPVGGTFKSSFLAPYEAKKDEILATRFPADTPVGGTEMLAFSALYRVEKDENMPNSFPADAWRRRDGKVHFLGPEREFQVPACGRHLKVFIL